MATAKKTASKKAAKKVVAITSTRGNTYQSTGDGRKKFNDLTGQGKLVADALVAQEPVTLNDLVAKVGSKLETKQEPKRVVGFYLSQWKTDGLVKFGPKHAKAA